MIVNAIVGFATSAVSGVLGFLPAGTGTTFNLAPAFGIMLTLDSFVPLHEALAGVAVCAALYVAVFSFGLVRQVWRFIPIIGGG